MTTFIHDGIEFILPTLFKATKASWAEDMIKNGTIYFTNIRRYQTDANDQRGDSREGIQVLRRNDVTCTIHYNCAIHVWCATMETSRNRILDTWKDYDTVIQIQNTWEFAQRIKAKAHPARLSPVQIGPVSYTKTNGGHEHSDWADGIFQKDARYDGQKEYRIALTARCDDEVQEQIILNIGPCEDIMRIVDR